ncbi:hypothetical protein [Pueribacillus sp. YX66]|uniref:hypothetical protein n=1 Tax=Pueribacillus sp. YX66 TaxID=3229242 RepID=UPI00358D5CC0
MKPEVKGLTSLDAAVLMEKMIILNGMLVHGTEEEKQRATEEWNKLEPIISRHLNCDAFEMAKRELMLEDDRLTPSSFQNLF